MAREHAAPGGGPNDGELLEREVDRPRGDSFTEDDIHPEIFHHRVDELLDGFGEAMDLVDEEDGASTALVR